MHLLPGSATELTLDLSMFKQSADFFQQELRKRFDCACPSTGSNAASLDREFARRFMPGIPMLLNEMSPQPQNATNCPSAGFTSNFFTGSNAQQLFGIRDKLDLALPATCTYKSYTEQNKCGLQYALTVNGEVNRVQLALSACPASPLPYVSVSCDGNACRDMLKPCDTDSDCAGNLVCTHLGDRPVSASDLHSLFTGLGLLSSQQDAAPPSPSSCSAFDKVKALKDYLRSLWGSAEPAASATAAIRVCSATTLATPAAPQETARAVTSESSDAQRCRLAAPACRIHAIGNGKCDPACNVAACHHDGNDCRNAAAVGHQWVCTDGGSGGGLYPARVSCDQCPSSGTRTVTCCDMAGYGYWGCVGLPPTPGTPTATPPGISPDSACGEWGRPKPTAQCVPPAAGTVGAALGDGSVSTPDRPNMATPPPPPGAPAASVQAYYRQALSSTSGSSSTTSSAFMMRRRVAFPGLAPWDGVLASSSSAFAFRRKAGLDFGRMAPGVQSTASATSLLYTTCDGEVAMGGLLNDRLRLAFRLASLPALSNQLYAMTRALQTCRAGSRGVADLTETQFRTRWVPWDIAGWLSTLTSPAPAAGTLGNALSDWLFPAPPPTQKLAVPSSCTYASYLATGACRVKYTAVTSLLKTRMDVFATVKKCPNSKLPALSLSVSGAVSRLLTGRMFPCVTNDDCPRATICTDYGRLLRSALPFDSPDRDLLGSMLWGSRNSELTCSSRAHFMRTLSRTVHSFINGQPAAAASAAATGAPPMQFCMLDADAISTTVTTWAQGLTTTTPSEITLTGLEATATDALGPQQLSGAAAASSSATVGQSIATLAASPDVATVAASLTLASETVASFDADKQAAFQVATAVVMQVPPANVLIKSVTAAARRRRLSASGRRLLAGGVTVAVEVVVVAPSPAEANSRATALGAVITTAVSDGSLSSALADTGIDSTVAVAAAPSVRTATVPAATADPFYNPADVWGEEFTDPVGYHQQQQSNSGGSSLTTLNTVAVVGAVVGVAAVAGIVGGVVMYKRRRKYAVKPTPPLAE